MQKPSPEVVKSLANISKQYSEVLEWVENWHLHELHQLPYSLNNPALQQGRCQAIGELVRLLREAPESAAKS